jgi:exodeoxyribonuclease V beta subunit
MTVPFDLNGPLGNGTDVLEASAGTGKTYALVHRLLREVAERSRPLDQLLVVTFTRAAAAEIRQRVRQRLDDATLGLLLRLAGQPPPEADPTLAALLDGWVSSNQGLAALVRLLRASDRLDLAPITTIHGFVQRLIRENAAVLGLDPGLQLQEHGGELQARLLADWRRGYLGPSPTAWQAWLQSHPDLASESLSRLAALVDDDRDMRLPPPVAADAPLPWQHWQTLQDRLLPSLQQEAPDLGEALASLLRGSANGTPKVCGKRELPELPGRVLTAAARFAAEPAPATARRYRELLTVIGTDGLRRLLADPDSAPVGGVHGLADRLLHEPVELLLADLVHRLRRGLAAERAQRQQLSFGDLLERVDPAQLPPAALEALRDWSQRRFSAILIDEFQDTDPIQWRLFQALGDGRMPLVLIGDPKQAIYRFRGGDIRTYRLATGGSDRQRASLTTNRRSDPALLEPLNRLFSPEQTFAGAGLDCPSLRAPSSQQYSRLRQADGTEAPPLRLRWIADGTPGKSGFKGSAQGPLLQSLPRRLADDLQATLAAGLERWHGDRWRALTPGDLAVLVNRNSDAVALQRTLLARGIPARIARGGDLWGSPEAASLALALQALERPGQRPAAAALALSGLGGRTTPELATWDAAAWAVWLEQLDRARDRWARLGPLAALEVLLDDGLALGRTGALPGGQQRLSDLAQMGELLQEAWQDQGQPSAARLALWLEQRRLGRRGDDDEGSDGGQQQRLVASGDLVTVSTLHASKGLQFPLVWCPSLWRVPRDRGAGQAFSAWDGAAGRRCLDVGRADQAEPRRTRLQQARLESFEEQLRLAYVGLTRAMHQLTIDWGRIDGAGASPAAWLLHPDARQDGETPWAGLTTLLKQEPNLLALLEERGRVVGFSVEQAVAAPAAPTATEPPPITAIEPPPAPPRRPPPRSPWGRWSYSRLVDHSPPASEQEEEGLDRDRGPGGEEAGPEEHPAWAVLPGGTAFGTLVHAVLERLDYTADPLADAGQQILREAVARSGLDPERVKGLGPAIAQLLRQPLGGPVGALTLADLRRQDTLRELPFDWPITGFAGGEGRDVLAEVLSDLCRHPDPLVSAYAAERLQEWRPRASAGFLTGVIDLVFRSPQGCWVVLDWKTNRLNRPIAAIMAASDYWLQAEIYRRAVVRFLRWRLGLAPEAPCPVDAVMLFTRAGSGAWLRDPGAIP